MQLYYTRKLKTQLTNPRLPPTGAGSYLAPGFFIPPSALMRDDWGRVNTGTFVRIGLQGTFCTQLTNSNSETKSAIARTFTREDIYPLLTFISCLWSV